MAEITVKFLDQTYVFPEEIREYISHCKHFQSIKTDLSDLMLEALELPPVDDEFQFIGFLERDIPAAMRSSGKKVIDMLAENGIYDVTLKELVDQNDGFIQHQAIHQKLVRRISSNMQEHLLALRTGQAQISNNAYSQVTGSGITLYSNSIAQHMAFSMFEAGTIRKQCSQADNEYKTAMTQFVNRTHSELDKKNAAVIVEQLPDVVGAIEDFITYLMEVYFSKLQNGGVFDYIKIKAYSIDHSGEILKNLDIVDDKKSVLHAAFKACPFNLDVYTGMLELGIEDREVFNAAKSLGLADILSEKILEYCKEQKTAGKLPKFPITVLVTLTDQSLTDVLCAVLEEEVSTTINEYQAVKQAILDNKKLDFWMRKFIVGETEKLILFDEKHLESRISEAIHNIGTNTQYRPLICNKLLPSDLMNFYGRQIATFEEFEAVVIEMLFVKISEYIKEAKRRRSLYTHAVKENSDAVSQCDQNIERLQAELKTVGLFAFSKRSEINRKIDAELTKRHELTNNTQHIDELKKAFVEMYR